MSEDEIRLALAERAIDELRHRARNDRQAVLLLESECDELRRGLAVLKARLYGGVAVALILGPLFAWVLEILR